MSSFTQFNDTLRIEYLSEFSREKRKDYWKVLESFIFYSDESGLGFRIWIKVPTGFITDGASVPKPFWSLFPPLGNYGQAAILHDYLRDVGLAYHDGEEWIGNKYKEFTVSVKESDYIFLEAMKVLGVGWIKRTIMFLAVRAYAKFKYGLTK